MATAAQIATHETNARAHIASGANASAVKELRQLVIAIGSTPATDAGETRIQFQKLEWADLMIASLSREVNAGQGIIRSKITYIPTTD